MILYRTTGPGPENRHVKGNWFEFPDDMAKLLLTKHRDHWSDDPKHANPPVQDVKPKGFSKRRGKPKE